MSEILGLAAGMSVALITARMTGLSSGLSLRTCILTRAVHSDTMKFCLALMGGFMAFTLVVAAMAEKEPR